MRTNIIAIGLLVAATALAYKRQDVIWRAARPVQDSSALTLGRPEPITQIGFVPIAPADPEPPRVIRGQAPPPPPPFPGTSGSYPVPPGAYENGVVNTTPISASGLI